MESLILEEWSKSWLIQHDVIVLMKLSRPLVGILVIFNRCLKVVPHVSSSYVPRADYARPDGRYAV